MDLDWQNIKCTFEFLELAASLMETFSSLSDSTLPLEPRIYKKLISHCYEWQEEPTNMATRSTS